MSRTARSTRADRPHRARARARVLAPVAVALCLGLSACGGAQAGAAAVVDGRRISTSAVNTATTQLQRWVGTQQTLTPRDILQLLVLQPFVVKAGSQAGVVLSAAQAQQAILSSGRLSDPATSTVEALQAGGTLQRLQQAAQTDEKAQAALAQVQQQLAKAKVQVNPRFGTFDPTTQTIVNSAPDWLVTTASGAGPTSPGSSSSPSGSTP